MFCKKCGKEIPDGSAVCPECGENLNTYVKVEEPVNPGRTLGVTSLILGAAALATQVLGNTSILTFPAAIAGIICALIAMSKSKAADMKCSSAKIGIILSIVSAVIDVVTLIASILLIVFFVVLRPLMSEIF